MRVRTVIALLSVAALAAACSDSSSTLSPTTSAPTANSDGTLLKATAPTPTAPANSSTLAQGVTSVQLQATAGAPQFGTGAYTHRFEVYKGQTIGAIPVLTISAVPSGTTVAATASNLNSFTAYTWRVRAEASGVAGPWSAPSTFTTSGQPRRDAAAFGGKIPSSVPKGDLQTYLFGVAAAHDTELQASCNNGRNALDFPTILLQTLRTVDNRWGYNCRRGNCSDPSNDVVVYHYGVGHSEGSTDVWIFDVIGGRDKAFGCDAHILDVTADTLAGGTVGRFSLLGLFPPNNPDN